MKIRNNARNGLLISTIIVVVTVAMIIIVNTIPNSNINTLNSTNEFQYHLGINKGETPIWKTICYIIIGALLVLSLIVNFVMCRCHFCGRHIHIMNMFTMYCPYCGKSLDKTQY